jgi:hypothetical protein
VSVVNLLGTGAAYTLASIDELDILIAGGRKVLITQDVYDEIMRSGDYGPKFKQWYNNNLGSIIDIDDPITDADKKKYNPTNKLKQEGDVSIKKFLDNNYNNG